jgi:nitric oxide reductase NorD protein
MGGLHHLLEPEETVGTLWHRMTERMAPPARYPAAAVSLETERGRLAVFFRGLGGAGGVELKALQAQRSEHRLGFLRRIGSESERIAQARFDGVVLGLPDVLDVFPQATLNSDLYLWLAAISAFAKLEPIAIADPLQHDLMSIRRSLEATEVTLGACPGLRPHHRRLALAALSDRPFPQLPPVEAAVEWAVRALLARAAGEEIGRSSPLLDQLCNPDDALKTLVAPLSYRHFRPVPLWPAIAIPAAAREKSARRDDEAGSAAAEGGEKRLAAERRKGDQADRRDSLILHRFEHILSWAEFLNINRAVDDDQEDNARKIADDADRISVVKNRKKAVTRLKFDLDLAPDDVDTEKLSGTHLYPEWDYRRGIYHQGHCRVMARLAEEAPDGLKLDGAARRRITAVRRRFEALRPKRAVVPRQIDGYELDLEAAVRAAVDIRASGEGSDRIWRRCRDDERDLAVSVLVDTSRSTEGSCGGRTVIEIAREALVALVEGIAACGDSVAVHAFSSLRRDRVFIRTVKGFDERIDERVRARIGGLRPGFYTRIGTAIRHCSGELARRPNRKKLLLVLTDGKPNDLDHYEGRYGVEDTRRAVIETRRQGMAVFGVTVDAKARAYFPFIFGAGGFAIVSRADKLAEALPIVWQQLTDG